MKKILLIALFLGNIFNTTAQLLADSGTYQIKFLEINKENSDYAVAMLDDNKLVFTSEGKEKKSSSKNYNPRKNLFIGDIDFDGEILNIQPVPISINDKLNTTGVTYSKDKKTVYFSRNKYIRSKSKQAKPKYQRLDLYKANVDNEGNWTNITKLPFNDDKYSTGYPTLSGDNKKLYFSSDRLPTMGSTDIFVVDIKADGTFGKPINLGKKVNSSGKETTPFITDKNVLYFSSNGHEGNGNLDIYATEVFDNYVSEIYHLEAPINSINDDFAYIINSENDRGFFTSNRLQGSENNDLYSFNIEERNIEEDCFITVEGLVKDKESQELLNGAMVDLLDIEGSLIETIATSNEGAYEFSVPCSQEYKLVASNDSYQTEEKHIEILDKNYHRSLHANLNLTKEVNENALVSNESNEIEKISIKAIHFDFDKSALRTSDLPELDKVVQIMKDNTNLQVEANAYTDSRGRHAYNKVLSQRRADAAVKYIISKGISSERISGKGYGEEHLINHCVDNSKCSEWEHQQNRRTEFIIVNKQASISNEQEEDYQNRVVINTADYNSEDKEIVTFNNSSWENENGNSLEIDKLVAPKENKVEEPKSLESVSSIAVVAQNEIKALPKKSQINSIDEESLKPIVVKEEKVVAKVDEKLNVTESKASKRTNVKTVQQLSNSENRVENYIFDQKGKIIENLTSLENKYSTAIETNSDLSESLRTEKEKVTEYKKEIADNKEIGWSNIITYKNQTNSFNKTYNELTGNVDAKSSRSSSNGEIIVLNDDEPETKKPEVAKVEEKKELLDVKNVEVIAMKKNDKGIYAETNSAKKADMIKVSFKLMHNEKVLPGQKEAHVILQNPEGKVTNAKGVFTPKSSNEMSKYTDHTVFTYNNNDINVTMFIDRKGYQYEKGNYPVKLFLEGELVAVSNLNLSSRN